MIVWPDPNSLPCPKAPRLTSGLIVYIFAAPQPRGFKEEWNLFAGDHSKKVKHFQA
jgi:hypothetical protein